ncbi:helix-turn-helix domain-containing protein [Palaeococcus ferrophilus]|uniref:helix-turn-helix domain-containing protein n=1 Tax=Palaeococcus ferrophilus TaxID=83868 RepID=UPI00064F8543|nr:helix-turn-helix domain-containing protein [Palaeococcus ferrophilus]
MKKAALITLLLIILPLASAQYTAELSLTVYRDGYVGVDIKIVPDEYTAQVSIPLPGSTYESLFVVDEEGNPLDYSVEGGTMVINTGNASLVEVSYYTPDLTTKAGPVWTLSLNSSVPFTVVLPEGTTVVDLSDVPLSIAGENITMPSGNQSISYVLSASVNVEEPSPSGSSYTPAIAVILLLFAALAAGVYLRRPREKGEEKPLDKDAYLKKMEGFELNDYERDALLYILERGGRASQAEVRKALDIPKTTAWRMFKRLEKQGLVKIVKGSKENWVELKP